MNTTPKFFLPRIPLPKHEAIYHQIRLFVDTPNYPITDRRIFKLSCEHNGDIKVGRTEIEVGKPLYDKGETVIAIFESNGWYLVCTKSRGALSGHPHCVSGTDVVETVEFGIPRPATDRDC